MKVNSNRGFSLVELLVTLIIIAVIASIIFPSSKIMYVREKETDLKYYLKRMREGIDQFKENNPAGAPAGLIVPGDGVDNDGDGSIDEEIEDGIDNDGDGFIDEDLVPSGYPVSLKDIVNNHCIRRIPSEPFSYKWQYRSSTGPVDDWKDFDDYGGDFNAQPGDDIFDIRTSNTDLSINGEIYSTW